MDCCCSCIPRTVRRPCLARLQQQQQQQGATFRHSATDEERSANMMMDNSYRLEAITPERRTRTSWLPILIAVRFVMAAAACRHKHLELRQVMLFERRRAHKLVVDRLPVCLPTTGDYFCPVRTLGGATFHSRFELYPLDCGWCAERNQLYKDMGSEGEFVRLQREIHAKQGGAKQSEAKKEDDSQRRPILSWVSTSRPPPPMLLVFLDPRDVMMRNLSSWREEFEIIVCHLAHQHTQKPPPPSQLMLLFPYEVCKI